MQVRDYLCLSKFVPVRKQHQTGALHLPSALTNFRRRTLIHQQKLEILKVCPSHCAAGVASKAGSDRPGGSKAARNSFCGCKLCSKNDAPHRCEGGIPAQRAASRCTSKGLSSDR